MNYFSLTKPKPSSLPSPEIQKFISSIEKFKKNEIPVEISEALKNIEKIFSQPVKLKHSREIYPVYKKLSYITNEIAKNSLEDLTNSWEEVLKTLEGRKIHNIGLGFTSFDTSIAQNILKNIPTSLEVYLSNLKDKQELEKVVNYIYKMDQEIFGKSFQKGFITYLLKSDQVKCIIARNEKEKIVGILWGFQTKHDKNEIFHFWELSRIPTLANKGIAEQLIDCAKKNQPDSLQFATLNVDADNQHAKEIYDKERFQMLNTESAKKNFMTLLLSPNSTVSLSKETSKKIVRNFVLKNVPFYKLVCYQLITICQSVWKNIYYR